jgi:tetratricopeptide (TPR) repeat protein
VAGNRKFPLYAVLVSIFFLAGMAFDAVALGSILRIDGVAPFASLLEDQAPEFVLLTVFAGLLIFGFLTFSVYAVGLDPFAADRPRALVYLNFLPLGFFSGLIYLISVSGSGTVPDLPVLIVSAVIGFTFPVAVLFGEVLLGSLTHRLGRRFDDAGWTGAAYFFLMTSLRWRPAVAETSRRCGLLLADMGRIRAAKDLLERAEGSSGTDDFEVLKVLEKAYLLENRGLEALRFLERRRVLRPDLQALDQRYLEQCLALEEWDRAITMLESDAFELDIEGFASCTSCISRRVTWPKRWRGRVRWPRWRRRPIRGRYRYIANCCIGCRTISNL